MRIAPVLITTFNKPKCLQQVLGVLGQVDISAVYFAIDAPNDANKAQMTAHTEITAIVDAFSKSKNNIRFLRHESNQGCRIAMQKAINWFFENEEMGIILEEDCLPSVDFFTFSTEMLTLYREDESIFHISGSNFQLNKRRGSSSYYYSKVPHIWGWASWRRAWKYYEDYINDQSYDDIAAHLQNKPLFEYHKRVFTKTNSGEINTWDYQWFYAIWKNQGVCITTNYNLITNIGFGPEATHTYNPKNSLSALPIENLPSPIIHPKKKCFKTNADDFYYRKHLAGSKSLKSILAHLYNRARSASRENSSKY